MYNNLLDEDPYIKQKKAEGVAEGLAKGLVQGEAKGEAKGRTEGRTEGRAEGLQEAVIAVVEIRFPPLSELAQKKVPRIKKPDTLRLLLQGLKTVSDEAAARLLIELVTA